MTTQFRAPGKQEYYAACQQAAANLTDVVLNSIYAIDAAMNAADTPPTGLSPAHARSAAAAACRQERGKRIQDRISRSLQEHDHR